MKNVIKYSVLLIVLVVVVGLFILPKEIEEYLSNYPHTLQALIGLFTLLTTTLSIGVAYATYSKNIKQQKKIEEEKKRSFEENSKRVIENLIDELRESTRSILFLSFSQKYYDVDFLEFAEKINLKKILLETENKILKERKNNLTLLTNDDKDYLYKLYLLCYNSRGLLDVYENTSRDDNEKMETNILNELLKLRETILFKKF